MEGSHSSQQKQLLAVAHLAMLNFREEVSKDDESSLWWSVPDAAKPPIKAALLSSMSGMQHRSITRSITDCVFAVGGREFAMGDWPELWGWMLAATDSDASASTPLQREMALYLMEQLSWTILDAKVRELPAVVARFAHNIESAYPPLVRMAALRAAGTQLICIEQEASTQASLIAHYTGLGPSFLHALNSFIQAGDTKGVRTTLDILNDVCSLQPAWFEPISSKCIPVLLQLAGQSSVEGNIRELAFEVTLAWAEAAPALARKYGGSDRVFLQATLPTLFELLMQVHSESAEEWGRRQESVEQDPYCTSRTAATFMQRLGASLGGQRTLALAYTIAAGLLRGSAWPQRYAGMQGLVHLIEAADSLDEASLSKVANDAIQGLGDSSPQVRYASLSLIGQLAHFNGPAFQEMSHATVLPLLGAMLQDSVPRVATHSASCCMNYVKYCVEEQVAPHLDTLLSALKAHLAYPGATAREECMSAIGCVVEVCPTQAAKYVPILLPDVMSVAGTDPAALKATPSVGDMRAVRARAFGCIASFVECMTPAQFAADADTVLGIFQRALSTPREDDDPLGNHLWTALGQITNHVGGDIMGKYYPVFIPTLQAGCSVSNIATLLSPEEERRQRQADPEDEDDDDAGYVIMENEDERLVRVQTTSFEDLVACLRCMSTLMAASPAHCRQFVDSTLPLLLPLLDLSTYIFGQVKTYVLKAMNALMGAAASEGPVPAGMTPPTPAGAFAKALPKLTQAVAKERGAEMAKEIMEALRVCMEVCCLVPDSTAEALLSGSASPGSPSPMLSPPGPDTRPPRAHSAGGVTVYDSSPLPGVVFGPFYRPLLGQADCESLVGVVLKAHADSNQRAIVVAQSLQVNEHMYDEEEADKQMELIVAEEHLQTSCFFLLGSMLKTHRDAFSAPLSAKVLPLMQQLMQPGASEGTLRQAVFLIDDMLENHASPDAVWRQYGAFLQTCAKGETTSLRHCASYGLGAGAACCSQMDAASLEGVMAALGTALEKERALGAASPTHAEAQAGMHKASSGEFHGSQVTDNITSAIFKLAVYQLRDASLARLQAQAISTGLSLLPVMQYDVEEVRMVVSLLCQRIVAGDDAFLGGAAWPHLGPALNFMLASLLRPGFGTPLLEQRLQLALRLLQSNKQSQLQAAVSQLSPENVAAATTLLQGAASPSAASPGAAAASPPRTPS